MDTYQLEYAELANALYMALRDDGFYQALENAAEGVAKDKKNAMLKYMDYSIIESQEFGECYIPDDQHYGVSIWSYPLEKDEQNHKDSLKSEFIRSQMGARCHEHYVQMCQTMAENAAPLIEKSDWYLSIIGILPDFQGQGLGPSLVESVLQKTDSLGLGTYLETFTERNKSFYQRLGYTDAGEFFEPVSRSTYWLMRRAAQNSEPK